MLILENTTKITELSVSITIETISDCFIYLQVPMIKVWFTKQIKQHKAPMNFLLFKFLILLNLNYIPLKLPDQSSYLISTVKNEKHL